MAKHPSGNKPGSDPVSPAQPAPDPSAKNPAAVQLGRLGGLKRGPARARKLTPEQRAAIARKAALARWARRRQP